MFMPYITGQVTIHLRFFFKKACLTESTETNKANYTRQIHAKARIFRDNFWIIAEVMNKDIGRAKKFFELMTELMYSNPRLQ